jgi:hypothetical protein
MIISPPLIYRYSDTKFQEACSRFVFICSGYSFGEGASVGAKGQTKLKFADAISGAAEGAEAVCLSALN